MIDDNLFKELNCQNWKDISKYLTVYADRRIRFKSLPKCKESKDYAMEAIKKLYTGERTWNKEKYSDLTEFLTSVVDSLISNDVRIHFQRKTGEFIDEEGNDKFDTLPSKDLPHDYILESEDEAKKLREEIKEALKKETSDKENLEILLEYVEDYSSLKELSKTLNLEIEEIYRLRKKLKQITKKVLENRKIN